MSSFGKDIFLLIRSSTITRSLDVLRGVVVMKFVTPDMLGLLDVVNQAKALAKYGDLGFGAVVEREYNFTAVKDISAAEKIRNTGYSGELVLTFFLTALVAISSFWLSTSMLITVAILSAALGLGLTKFVKLLNLQLRIKKNFADFARYQSMLAIFTTVMVIATVPFMGALSPLIFQPIALLIVALMMFRKIGMDLQFQLPGHELKRQLRVGLKLGLITVLFGAGIYTERLLILHYYSATELGFFAFSAFFLNFFQTFIYDVVRPVMPDVREALGRGDTDQLAKDLMKPMLLTIAVTALAIFALKIFVEFAILHFFTKYTGAIPSFHLLIYNLYFIASSAFMGFILYSPKVERTRWVYYSHIVYIVVLAGVAFLTRGSHQFHIFCTAFIIANSLRALTQNFAGFSYFLRGYKLALSLFLINILPALVIFYLIL